MAGSNEVPPGAPLAPVLAVPEPEAEAEPWFGFVDDNNDDNDGDDDDDEGERVHSGCPPSRIEQRLIEDEAVANATQWPTSMFEPATIDTTPL